MFLYFSTYYVEIDKLSWDGDRRYWRSAIACAASQESLGLGYY